MSASREQKLLAEIRKCHHSTGFDGDRVLDLLNEYRVEIAQAQSSTVHEDGSLQGEGYSKGWARAVLMVSPDGQTIHCVGGDRVPGDGDRPYIGYERIKKRLAQNETK